MEKIPDEHALVKHQKGEVVKQSKGTRVGAAVEDEPKITYIDIDGGMIEDPERAEDQDVTVTEEPIPSDLPFINPVQAEVVNDGETKDATEFDQSILEGEILESDKENSDAIKPEIEVTEPSREILKEEKLLNYLNTARQKSNEYYGVFNYVINGVEDANRPDFLKTRKDWAEDFTISSPGVVGKFDTELTAAHALVERLANEAESRLLKKEKLKKSKNLDDHFLVQLAEESEGTDREYMLNSMIDAEPMPILSKKKIREDGEAARLEAERLEKEKLAAEKAKKDAADTAAAAAAQALIDSIKPDSPENLHDMFTAIEMTAGLTDFDQDVFDRIMAEANLDDEEKILLRKQHQPYAHSVMSVEEKNKLASARSKVRAVAEKIKSEKVAPGLKETVETIGATELDKIIEGWFSQEIKNVKFDFKYTDSGIKVEVKQGKFGKKDKPYMTFDLVNDDDSIETKNVEIHKGLYRLANGIGGYLKPKKVAIAEILPGKIIEALEEKSDKEVKSINIDGKGLKVTYVEKGPVKGKIQRVKEVVTRAASKVGKGTVAAVKDSGEIAVIAGGMAASLAADVRDIPKNIKAYREQRRNYQQMTSLGLRGEGEVEEDTEDFDLPLVDTGTGETDTEASDSEDNKVEADGNNQLEQGTKNVPESPAVENDSKIDSNEKPKPVKFTTAKGSTYTYLPDGRTKRFKKATGEEFDPQDICVFVPPWGEIKDEALRLYPQLRGVENEAQFDQVILSHIHEDGFTTRITDRGGNVISRTDELEAADEAFMYLIDKNNPGNSFAIPVSKEPLIGYSTYDSRSYEENGQHKSERHFGNKVVDIQYSK